MNKKNKLKLIKGGLTLAFLFLFYFIFCGIVGGKKFFKNTTINGINVSGMTIAQASTAIDNKFKAEYYNAEVAVTLADKTYNIPVSDALNLDVNQAVTNSLKKNNKFFSRGFNYIKCLFVNSKYEAVPTIKNMSVLSKNIEDSGITSLKDSAQAAYTLNDDSVTVTKGRGGYAVDEDSLIKKIEKVFEGGDLSVVIDCPLKYSEVDLQLVYDSVYSEPQNATLDPKNNYELVEAKQGIKFDMTEAKSLLDSAKDGEKVNIPIERTDPEISTEDLEANLFKDQLATFSTNVGGSSARKSNVSLAADKCNNYILVTGQEFGFNETVGQRTSANGFQAAPAYVNGDTVEELGGGICQVSSTIYNACLRANLEISERHNHSYTSSYVDPGFDATVSWNGPNYKFKNDKAYPIKIVMVYSGGVLTCTVYGTNTDNITVKMTSEVLSVDNFETVYEDDETLSVGKQFTAVVGETGTKIQTYRNLYDASGNLISSNKESLSNYKRRDKVIKVGTLGKVTEAPTTEENTTQEPEVTEKATEETTTEAESTEETME